MKPIFIGSGVAIVTPFDKDGKIDFETFKTLIDNQIINKTDAVIVCGTTGEGSTLTVDERLELFDFAVKRIDGRVPVIAGTGSNSTSFTLSLAKQAETQGIDAHLIVTPYYNKTSQKGLIEHYFALADNLEKPVIIYNVPSRTGMNITPETYCELAKHKNIVGVKEADSNIPKMIKSMSLCKDNLHFYTGNDDNICPAMSVGCKGAISVLANILPEYTHNMVMSGYNGDFGKCSQMQKRCIELVNLLFSDVNPIPIKAALELSGFNSCNLRLPLVKADVNLYQRIETELRKFI